MTEYVRFEDDSLSSLKRTSLLDTRFGDFEKLRHGRDGVTGFDFILYDTMLLVKMKVTLAYVVRGSTG